MDADSSVDGQRSKGKSQPTVLVIDDEPAILGLLEKALTQSGFGVLTAIGGEAAVRLYQEQNPSIDLVLLDVQMPGLDGPATLVCLKEINPRVRCCFMSGSTGKYTSQELLDMGAAHVMMKPFVSLNILTRFLWDVIG